MRRALLAAATVAVAGAIALVPSTAGAHGEWSTQWTDPVPTETIDGQQAGYLDGLRGISGVVSHAHVIENVNLLLAVPHEPADGCDATGSPASFPGGGTSVSFTFQIGFPCNIVYRVRVAASARAGEGDTFDADPAPPPADMPLLVAVAIPPDPVRGVQAELIRDTVDVTWSPNREADLIGYQVVRVIDGEREVIAELEGAEATSYRDVPPAGATVSYDVIAVRPGPTEKVRTVSSSSSPSNSVEVPEPEEEDADEDDGESDDGEESDGDGSSGGDGDGDGDGDGPALGSSTGAGGGRQPGSVGVSSRPASGGGPPTTADTGFSETLPFGAPDPEMAVPPTGRDVVASFDDAEQPPLLNEETWTFVAAGLALFMGSMVIRYVTRRAAAGY